MDTYEENLLRLNQKIRELMTHIDTLETKNRKLQQENHVLVEDVASFRVQYAIAEEGRLQCKAVLEREMVRSSEEYDSKQLLKKRYNELIKEYVAQNQKLQAYESQDNAKQEQQNRKKVPVEIIGKPFDLGKPKVLEEKVSALESRCAALEKELQKAHAVIDDLEFELESIDHLEDTNQQLEKQIRKLKVETVHGCRCSALPAPTSADGLSSPLHSSAMYTFESLETAEHGGAGQDGAKEYTTPAIEEASVVDNESKIIREAEHLEPMYSNTTEFYSNTTEHLEPFYSNTTEHLEPFYSNTTENKRSEV